VFIKSIKAELLVSFVIKVTTLGMRIDLTVQEQDFPLTMVVGVHSKASELAFPSPPFIAYTLASNLPS
jgi:hypothetical protein